MAYKLFSLSFGNNTNKSLFQIESSIQESMRAKMNQYGQEPDVTKSIDELQVKVCTARRKAQHRILNYHMMSGFGLVFIYLD